MLCSTINQVGQWLQHDSQTNLECQRGRSLYKAERHLAPLNV
jgi:hypothetical protein